MAFRISKNVFIVVAIAALSGCMNMPTPTAQITGSYTSNIRYEQFSCDRLATEVSSLARRENQLSVAQEQRIKSSQMQAFWWGFGQGDGIEASELANVRGEKEAVRNAMEAKSCDPSLMPVAAPVPVPEQPRTPTGRNRNKPD